MKICHVNLASGFSGGEQQTLELIKQQLQLGYHLTVVVNPKSELADKLEHLNCTLVSATHYLFQHSRAITKGCTAIHVHEGRAVYWALIQSKLYGVPYIVTRRIDKVLKKNFLSSYAFANARALIGLSHKIIAQIAAQFSTDLLYLIPSSPVTYTINRSTVGEIKAVYKDKFLVMQAGNMIKHKGFDITVGAAHLMQKKDSSVHFLLLGDGSERAQLALQAEGLENITFCGKQNNMGDWFAAADLFIHPSYTEGLGSVILEAIVAGLPVIGTAVGGIPDIIDNAQNGLIIEPGKPQLLVDAILNIKSDASLVEKFKCNNLEKMRTFDIKVTAQKYQDIYQSLN